MKNESLSESMPKLITTITIVVLVGTLFGSLGYYLGNKNIVKNTPVDIKYQKDQLEKINEKEIENNKQEDADFLEKIADWKTYENKEYGFEVKYPKDWETTGNSPIFFDNPLYANKYKLFEGPGFEDKYKDYAWISIDRYPEGTKTAAGTVAKDTEIKDFIYKLYSKDYFTSVEKTTIGGQESYIFGYKPAWWEDGTTIKGQNNYFNVYLKQNNDIVVISMWSGPEYTNYETLMTTFNQLILTFKFTKSDKTADWKTYKNDEYGFEIILLELWKGYKVFEESWNGTTLDNNSVKYEGPKIVIRNPKWSEDKIWQDIPILVFTKAEWQLIEANNLNIFAAPIAPEKLGENNKYVFALPPRWIGFTDALKQDEAQKIVETFEVLALDKTKNLETYNRSKNKIGSDFSFKYSP